MRLQGFRGNCDSQGKLGMCPSLAESDLGGFPRRSVSNHKPQATKKFFGAAVFQKCCRGVGEQPTFAEQIVFCNLFSLLQLHFLKLANSQLAALSETSYKFEQGNGAIAACWPAKAGVSPFCRTLKIGFSKSRSCIVSYKHCSWEYHPNPVRQGWGTSPACLGIAIAPETL